jgi:glutamine synthetase
VLDDIVATLEAMGIGVVQYHAESAHGQFEIATVPFEPVAAAGGCHAVVPVVSRAAGAAGGLAACLAGKLLP